METTLTTSKVAHLTGHKASVFTVASGSDYGHILSGAGDGWVVRWNLDNPETGRVIAKVDTQIFSLCYLEAENKIVVGNMNGGVHWVDIENPDATRNIAHHAKGVFDIKRIGDHLFTLGGGGLLTRWSVNEGRPLESLQLTRERLRGLDYHSGRRELAIGASDHSIYFLDADTLELRRRVEGAHDNSVFTVRYAPDGRHLLSGGRDAQLKVWDLQSGKLVAAQPAHWFTINYIAIHPEGYWFATASRDKTVKIWDARTFQLLKVLDTARDGGHINSVNHLFWSPYRNYLVSCSDDRSLIIWSVNE